MKQPKVRRGEAKDKLDVYRFRDRPFTHSWNNEEVYIPLVFSDVDNETLFAHPLFLDEQDLMGKYLELLDRIYIQEFEGEVKDKLRIKVNYPLREDTHFHITPLIDHSSFCMLVKRNLVNRGIFKQQLNNQSGITRYAMDVQLRLELILHEQNPYLAKKYPEVKVITQERF